MTTTDVYSEIESAITTTTPTTTTREPQPSYDHDGEASGNTARSFSEVPRARGQNSTAERMSRPVTAATARRGRLWEKGTLVLEDPFGAHRVTKITEDWVAHTEPSDPELEPQVFELFPERTLVFATSSNVAEGPDGTEGQVDRERQQDGRGGEPARSHGDSDGPLPADHEQRPDRCEKCGAKQTEMFSSTLDSPGETLSGEGHAELDEIDTKHALWHLRSALEDAECIGARLLLKMGIKRDLQRAERILSNHAKRNGFDA